MSQFVFDYDLTLAIVIAHPDGTVYHRYGGRADRSPLYMETLVDLMNQALKTHHTYRSGPFQAQGTELETETAADLLQRSLTRESGISFGCIHCHYVRESRQTLAVSSGSWTPDQFWIWPSPARIGLAVNQRQQYLVETITPDSPAAVAGILPGDRLVSLESQRILTNYDIQWILNKTPDGPTDLPFEVLRGNTPHTGKLHLNIAWRVGYPSDYLWRIRNVFTEHMAKFLPTPGAIGTHLPESERQALGIGAKEFHLQVIRLNAGAYSAGLRRGDIILSANQRTHFQDQQAFHLHCETVRRSGRDLTIGLLRDENRMQIRFTQAALNEVGARPAPEVKVGFMPQELPLNQGLRVGHITDRSNAERSGLKIGDRILTVDNEHPKTSQVFKSIVDRKSPGDLLSITVNRNATSHSFSYLLPGSIAQRSNLAHLSEPAASEGQILSCRILLRLPKGKHIYSAHRVGFGLPTQFDFRGTGFDRVGEIREPSPTLVSQSNLDPMWTLSGTVAFEQLIKITDPDTFHLYLKLYAQVCDDRSCHELTSIVECDGQTTVFYDYAGDFESLSHVPVRSIP